MSVEICTPKLKINTKIDVKIVSKAGKTHFNKIVNNFTCIPNFCLLVNVNFALSNFLINTYYGIKLLTFPVLAKALERFFRGSLRAFYYKIDTH